MAAEIVQSPQPSPPAAPAPSLADASPIGVIVAGQSPRNVLLTWIRAKRTELTACDAAIQAAKDANAGSNKLARLRERRRLLAKCVEVMELGYVPIPRFDANKLNIEIDVLPTAALVALGEATQLGVFDEFRLVTGRVSDSRPARFGQRNRVNQRDPLIVGVLRTPEHRRKETDAHGWEREVVIPGREEHFLVAWWRPEDEREETLF